VPVVSDVHAQAPRAPKTSKGATKDPFANVPVVSDNVGTPGALAATTPPVQAPAQPASPAAPSTPPATPAGDSSTTDPAQPQSAATDVYSGGNRWFSENDSPGDTSSSTPPDPAQQQVTATIGSSDTGTLDSTTADATQQQTTGTTGSTGTIASDTVGSDSGSSVTTASDAPSSDGSTTAA